MKENKFLRIDKDQGIDIRKIEALDMIEIDKKKDKNNHTAKKIEKIIEIDNVAVISQNNEEERIVHRTRGDKRKKEDHKAKKADLKIRKREGQ
jgi:hypothetical protein